MLYRTLLLGASTLLVSAPALAADTPPADSLSIDVTATITERCGLAPAGTTQLTAPDLEKAQSLRFEFKIDCNTPFRIGVSSQNGALRLVGEASERAIDDGGFSVEKAYRVALDVVTDDAPMQPDECGSRAPVDEAGACDFFGAIPGRGLSSGRRTAINRSGSVTVKWGTENGAGARRAAGRYQDTITIVVGARS